MSVEHLVKGESDWHNKINQNFDTLDSEISAAVEAAEEAATTKVDKPVNQTKAEGYLYQNPDGTTKLVDGGEQEGKFKYTVICDNGGDSSPGAIEYADDCISFIEASASDLGDWANTNLIKNYFRPCVIKPGDGAPAYYLMQSDMVRKEDGTAAVITGADGDVMIEIKKLYGKFTKVGTKLKISIANYKEDDTWFCFNNIGGVEKDVVYRGAFKAGVASGATTVMRSISGVSPLVSITRDVGRTYATNRGVGYHQNNFFMLMLYQVMYLLLYKNKDSQSKLGQGRSLSTNTAAEITGWSKSKPFCWGDQGGVNGVKFLGVEDFYGNVWEWVDGACVISDVYKLTRDPSKYNDTGANYEISLAPGMTASANNDKYITKVVGTNDLGFLPAASGGSSATYWCDNMWLADATQVVIFGGSWFSAARVGAFCWYLFSAPSLAHATFGSRLCRA